MWIDRTRAVLNKEFLGEEVEEEIFDIADPDIAFVRQIGKIFNGPYVVEIGFVAPDSRDRIIIRAHAAEVE